MDFNVFTYGAKGDGVTDDTLSIQQALDAAYNAGGGTVVIPKGVFIVHGTSDASYGALQIRDNVTLTGAGMGETTIKLKDHNDHKLTGIIRTPSGEINKNVTLQDLTIDGNMANNKGEVDGFFCGVTPGSTKADLNITVQRVEIHDVSRYAFDPHERTQNLVIKDSVAHHNGKDGFVADFQLDGTFENNIAYDNGRHGFNIVTGSIGFDAKNLIAYGNGSNGIVVQRGSDLRDWTRDVRIEGGKFYGNGEDGINVKISRNVTVTNAESFENGKYGIHIMGSDGVYVYGNKVHDNSANGSGQGDEIQVLQYDDRDGATHQQWGSKNVFVALNNIYSDSAHKAYYSIRVMDDLSTGIHVGDNMTTGAVKAALSLGHNTDADVSGIVLLPPDDGSTTPPPDDSIPAGYDHHQVGTDAHEAITGTVDKDYIDGGNGNDTILGAQGNDFLKGGAGDDSISGSAGDDSLDGGAGKNVLDGGVGNDTITGGDDTDNIRGGSGSDLVSGNGGNDTISGFTGDDKLAGGAGNDKIYGNDGADTLSGGDGNDTLYGGNGADVYAISNVKAVELLGDFQQGVDKIDVSEFHFASYDEFRAETTVTAKGGLVTIALDSDTSILLKGAVADVTPDDFIF